MEEIKGNSLRIRSKDRQFPRLQGKRLFPRLRKISNFKGWTLKLRIIDLHFGPEERK